MKAWKTVDAADAHFIESGSLKLGRLQDYATLENGRSDPLDGTTQYRQNPTSGLSWENPSDRKAMARMGLQGVGFAIGTTHILRVPDTYAFCMSVPGCEHDPRPEIPKAVFEVHDIDALGLELQTLYADRLMPGHFGAVTYRQRRFDPQHEARSDPSPLVKEARFAPEQELRLFWRNRPGLPFETIFTPANSRIGGLFIRVR